MGVRYMRVSAIEGVRYREVSAIERCPLYLRGVRYMGCPLYGVRGVRYCYMGCPL